MLSADTPSSAPCSFAWEGTLLGEALSSPVAPLPNETACPRAPIEALRSG